MPAISGPGGVPQIVCGPHDRLVQEGGVLFIDTGSCFDGHVCDFDRNYAIGARSGEVRRVHDALWLATEAGIAAAVPGATTDDVFRAMSRIIEEAGAIGNNVGRLGHGLGTILGRELERIGYAGPHEPGFLTPHAYVELHIEQGPVLEREGVAIGAVETLQGISWQRISIEGDANHAGTTPMSMRRDAGTPAARIVTHLRDRARSSATPTVATVGCLTLEPNAIDVIPSRAILTVDLRDPSDDRLAEEERTLGEFLRSLSAEERVEISVERRTRSNPVTFDPEIVRLVEAAAAARGLSSRRMTSGAGHDAQMMARIAPTAMIFVPSIGGISHNPKERTADHDLVAGANVLLDVVRRLAHPGQPGHH